MAVLEDHPRPPVDRVVDHPRGDRALVCGSLLSFIAMSPSKIISVLSPSEIIVLSPSKIMKCLERNVMPLFWRTTYVPRSIASSIIREAIGPWCLVSE